MAKLCDPAAEVSAHYVIGEDGTFWQLVEEANRAWHAGVGAWRGESDINSRSIGIELVNDGAGPFAAALMDRLVALLADVMARWAIAPENVIGHSDMSPGRKSDPGARFDWPRLEALGLARGRSLGAVPGDVSFAQFRARAQAAGYTAEASDSALLDAVRLRWRPGGRGPLCAEDFRALGAPLA